MHSHGAERLSRSKIACDLDNLMNLTRLLNHLSVAFTPIVSASITYAVLPYIYSTQGKDSFTSAVLVFTLFALVANFTLGIPVYVVKHGEESGFTTAKIRSLTLTLLPFSFAASIVFIGLSAKTLPMLLCVPLIAYLSIYRGYYESQKNFFISTLGRIFCTAALPSFFVFNTLGVRGNWVLGLVAFAIFLLVFLKKSHLLRKHFSKQLKELLNIWPYTIHSLYIFFFLYSDRLVLATFSDSPTLANFSYTGDFVYKLIMPLGIYYSLLFPYMCSRNSKTASNGTLIFYLGTLIWLLFVTTVPTFLLYVTENIWPEYSIPFTRPEILITSLTLITISAGLCLQRVMLASFKTGYISKIFLALLLVNSIIGFSVTWIFKDAILTIFVKSLIEFTVLFFLVIYVKIHLGSEE